MQIWKFHCHSNTMELNMILSTKQDFLPAFTSTEDRKIEEVAHTKNDNYNSIILH